MQLLSQLVIATVLVVSPAPQALVQHPPHPTHPDHPSDPTDLPVSPIPEPSSIILMGTGIALFAGLGLRRIVHRRAGLEE